MIIAGIANERHAKQGCRISADYASELHAKEHMLVTEARKESDVASVLERIRDAFFGELRCLEERLRGRVTVQLWAKAQRNPRILKILRRGVNGPHPLLSTIVSDARRPWEISDGVDPDAAARFMTVAFQSFALQTEWDGQIEVEPHTPF